MATHGTAKVAPNVEALEGFQTALVEHVGAIQKINIPVLVVLV
jgi:hypothetical protein